ncbi:tail assembly chaperone [Streptomyces phage Lizz]|nr:tail assembly chaperone [Streptomyces phage PHTowN]QNO12838.1 tail assembly chaperone [Streptomyces phage ShakeNBake]QYW07568.1 tail assembly chaperone [Streptomyces phage Lizz]
MALVTKQQISDAVDRKWEDVPVPEWGGDVRLMELSAADRGYIEAGSVVANGQTPQLRVESLKVYREKLVGMAMVDENFQRIYSNKEISAGALGVKSGAVIERLAAKVQEMSGMGRYAVKEAEGNSDAAPSDSSASA